MLFRIDGGGAVESVPRRELAELGLLERDDLQEWVIEQPQILGEELLIITSEYAGFEGTLHRLDVLALDPDGKLVVIELKRDQADSTADLQVLKYASFCSTLDAENIQKLYQNFHAKRGDEDRTRLQIREEFLNFLNRDDEFEINEDGWLQFELDNRPRMILAAGGFEPEITAPILWLYEEYGVDISCVRLSAYEWKGEYLIQGQRIIPIPEAEEYKVKHREKQERQRKSPRIGTYDVLLDRGVLQEGDELLFNEEVKEEDWAPEDTEARWDPTDELWQAVVTGKEGQSDNVQWRYDGEEYSVTGLTKAVLREVGEDDDPYVGEAFWYWTHPHYDHRPLSELRAQEASRYDRKEND